MGLKNLARFGGVLVRSTFCNILIGLQELSADLH